MIRVRLNDKNKSTLFHYDGSSLGLFDLHYELLLYLLNWVPNRDINTLSQTCIAFYNISFLVSDLLFIDRFGKTTTDMPKYLHSRPTQIFQLLDYSESSESESFSQMMCWAATYGYNEFLIEKLHSCNKIMTDRCPLGKLSMMFSIICSISNSPIHAALKNGAHNSFSELLSSLVRFKRDTIMQITEMDDEDLLAPCSSHTHPPMPRREDFQTPEQYSETRRNYIDRFRREQLKGISLLDFRVLVGYIARRGDPKALEICFSILGPEESSQHAPSALEGALYALSKMQTSVSSQAHKLAGDSATAKILTERKLLAMRNTHNVKAHNNIIKDSTNFSPFSSSVIERGVKSLLKQTPSLRLSSVGVPGSAANDKLISHLEKEFVQKQTPVLDDFLRVLLEVIVPHLSQIDLGCPACVESARVCAAFGLSKSISVLFKRGAGTQEGLSQFRNVRNTIVANMNGEEQLMDILQGVELGFNTDEAMVAGAVVSAGGTANEAGLAAVMQQNGTNGNRLNSTKSDEYPLYNYVAETKGNCLLIAVYERHLSVARQILVARAADLEEKLLSGKTALYVAAEKNFAEMCLLLCEFGADVGVKSCSALPLLHASLTHPRIVEVLVKFSGLDALMLQNSNGETIFDVAERKCMTNILVSLLRQFWKRARYHYMQEIGLVQRDLDSTPMRLNQRLMMLCRELGILDEDQLFQQSIARRRQANISVSSPTPSLSYSHQNSRSPNVEMKEKSICSILKPSSAIMRAVSSHINLQSKASAALADSTLKSGSPTLLSSSDGSQPNQTKNSSESVGIQCLESPSPLHKSQGDASTSPSMSNTLLTEREQMEGVNITAPLTPSKPVSSTPWRAGGRANVRTMPISLPPRPTIPLKDVKASSAVSAWRNPPPPLNTVSEAGGTAEGSTNKNMASAAVKSLEERAQIAVEKFILRQTRMIEQKDTNEEIKKNSTKKKIQSKTQSFSPTPIKNPIVQREADYPNVDSPILRRGPIGGLRDLQTPVLSIASPTRFVWEDKEAICTFESNDKIDLSKALLPNSLPKTMPGDFFSSLGSEFANSRNQTKKENALSASDFDGVSEKTSNHGLLTSSWLLSKEFMANGVFSEGF